MGGGNSKSIKSLQSIYKLAEAECEEMDQLLLKNQVEATISNNNLSEADEKRKSKLKKHKNRHFTNTKEKRTENDSDSFNQ